MTIVHDFNQFKKDNDIQFILGFSGDTDTKIPKVPDDDPLQKEYKRIQKERISRIIQDCLLKFQHIKSKVAILTGGTQGGVPECTTKIAKKIGFKTIGIYPSVGQEYFLGKDYIDFSFCVEPVYQDTTTKDRFFTNSCWGDESSLFAKLLDSVIVIGGSSGTLIEVAYILKLNKEILKGKTYYSHLKYIVPISGFGGVSEGIHTIFSSPEVSEKSILSYTFTPDKKRCSRRLYSGIQAADVLFNTEKLNLWDLY
jgi:hypothetical protein